MPRFDFARFLAETGVSLMKLSSYLRVAPTYLEAARNGAGRLTARDQAACRMLWRRLTKAKQLALPFAEPPATFTKSYARDRARAAAATSRTAGGRAPKRQRTATTKGGSA